jgi:circadian clock protein KaiC
VSQGGVRVVAIDSLNGYMHAMPGERHLTIQLHELLTYLNQRGIVTLLIEAQHGLVGDMHTPLDVSYLADTVVLLRYFEAAGRVRQAISVLKKRSGAHERTIRQLQISGDGIHLGPPLSEFQGVLHGTPTYVGKQNPLLLDPDEPAAP